MNILVFLHSREQFGAQIVHIPLLKYLRFQYPDAKIIAVSKFKAAKILAECGYIDHVFIGKGFSFYRKIIFQEKIDVAYSLQPTSYSVFLSMLFSGVKYRIGFSKKLGFLNSSTPYNKNIYRAINFFNIVNNNKISYEDICYKINDDYKINSRESLLLIPGAGGKEKRWPIDKFIRLANEIKEEHDVTFIIGPEDTAEERILIENKLNILKSPTMNVLFKTIAESKLVISADCGPSHIAHIMKKNQIVLYNKTLNEWFDYRNNSIAIECNTGVQDIEVEMVKQAIEKILELSK